MVQLVFTGIGGWLGYFLGGCDGLILALLLFVVADYITGIMCAIADKKLSSEVGFKGICRKVLIFMLVGIANVLDVQVIGNGSILRTAVIFFYLSNEGISLLENAAHLGLPIPEKLKKVLEQLHDRSEDGIEEKKDGDESWDLQIVLDAEIAELEQKLKAAETARDDSLSQALGMMKKYSKADELTQAMVQELIEKVVVTDPEHVEIAWKFKDEVRKFIGM